jgi:molybdate transport system substrate-binding protein
MRWKFAFAVLGLLAASPVQAADIIVMTSGGFTAALKDLAPAYEKQTGNHLILVFGPSMGVAPTAIPVRLARGEKADLVILARVGLDGLIAKGMVSPPATDLVQSGIAMAVKADVPVPDISTLAAFKKTLLAAKSVAYSDSASGVYIKTEMYKNMGIEDQMSKKSRMIQATPVGQNVARGDVELGFQQMAELKPIAGIKIVGYLPEGAQQMTFFSAGIVKNAAHPDEAKKLLAWLQSPKQFAAIRATGLTPASEIKKQ